MSSTSLRSEEGKPSVSVPRNKGGVEIMNRMASPQLNDTSAPHEKSPLARKTMTQLKKKAKESVKN